MLKTSWLLLAVALPAICATPEVEVRTVLNAQVQAWNRGDLAGFVIAYSPEAIFVGKEITRGNQDLLEHYRKTYSTPEKMGTLTFTDLEVKLLGEEYASVVGKFHLKRTAAGGGDANGIFTLLFKKTGAGWRIILDHTS
jgi:uncharacterized protein (TIGR02246 family)